MNKARQALGHVSLSPSDDKWPMHFRNERERLSALLGAVATDLQHYGSTAVPGLAAKPIIDMMGCVTSLADAEALRPTLETAGYVMIDAGFTRRRFFRRAAAGAMPAYHLHLVVCPSWPIKNELLLRDWLIERPEVAEAYAELKEELASQFMDDMPAYTASKTTFLRAAVNDARASRRLPPESEWVE